MIYIQRPCFLKEEVVAEPKTVLFYHLFELLHKCYGLYFSETKQNKLFFRILHRVEHLKCSMQHHNLNNLYMIKINICNADDVALLII